MKERSIHQYATKNGFRLEYSLVGSGEPILVMHGGHSNCHEELGYAPLAAKGYCIITPSRPGYGNTSAEPGQSIMTACEAYIELLDELQAPQAHVLAMSAGGPSGIYLASRYPNRVNKLILQSAVSRGWLSPDDKLHRLARIMFSPSAEKYVWASLRLMNKLFPRVLLSGMVPSFSMLPKEKVLPQISGEDRRLFKNMINRQRSGRGFMIDLEQTSHDLTSELASIQCPTLIMHSIYDASVPVEHARHAYRTIPNARLCELDSWGHLIHLGAGADAMYERLFSFLDDAIRC